MWAFELKKQLQNHLNENVIQYIKRPGCAKESEWVMDIKNE